MHCYNGSWHLASLLPFPPPSLDMGSAFPAERLALCWPRTQHCGTAQQLPAPTGYSVRGGAAPHGTHPSNLEPQQREGAQELRTPRPALRTPPASTASHSVLAHAAIRIYLRLTLCPDSLKQTANDVKHSGDAPWTTSSVHLSNHPSRKQ